MIAKMFDYLNARFNFRFLQQPLNKGDLKCRVDFKPIKLQETREYRLHFGYDDAKKTISITYNEKIIGYNFGLFHSHLSCPNRH